MKHKVIKLSLPTSLYDPVYGESLKEALQLVKHPEQSQDVSALIFEVDTQGSDFHVEWSKNSLHLLYDEMSEHLYILRSLIKYLLRSKVKTCFAFKGHCLDSYFELAMACDFRFALDSQGSVGFPQIKDGFYPGGGVFDRIAKNHPLLKFDWRKRSQYTTDEALAVGLIDGCSMGDLRMVLQALECRPKESYQWSSESVMDTDIAQEPFSTVKLSELTKNFGDRTFVNHLIYKPHKIIQQFASEKKYRIFLLSLTAHQYLSQKYQTYIKSSIRTLSSGFTMSEEHKSIFIELQEVIPPAGFIASLLLRDYAICFYCRHHELLHSNLSLLYDRLGSLVNAGQVYQKWNHKVRWVVGIPSAKSSLKISYHADRRVNFSRESKMAVFYAVDIRGSIVETHPTPEQWERNFYSLFDMVLELPRTVLKDISFATYLRSLFFEELISYCGAHGLKLHNLIHALHTRGWGFAGSIEAWETFLTNRHIDSELPPEPLGGFRLKPELWALEGLHSAQLNIRSRRGDYVEKTDIEIDFHFGFFAGLMALVLAKHILSDDEIKSEQFIAEILGCPKTDRMPLDYLRSNHLSSQNYISLHWSDYMYAFEGVGAT